MAFDLPKPKKGKKPKKITTKRDRAGESADERLKRDLALARQSTNRQNP